MMDEHKMKEFVNRHRYLFTLDELTLLDADINNAVLIWRDIPDWEGFYQANMVGWIKSLARTKIGRWENIMPLPEIIMKQKLRRYCTVHLRNRDISSHALVQRLVMTAFFGKSEKQAHHINEQKHDNMIYNLEYITPRENTADYHLRRPKTSKYVGVNFDKRQKTKQWKAQIHHTGKKRHIGHFHTEIEAHEAYQAVLKSLSLP